MRRISIALLFAFATLSVAASFDQTFPQHWESIKGNGYSTIVLHDATNATYFSRATRDDGTVWYYLDTKATWGRFSRDGWKNRFKKATDYIWISTTKFRYDYLVENGNLVEWDKMGRLRIYVRVENENKPQQGG
jgi:hypothetical protein